MVYECSFFIIGISFISFHFFDNSSFNEYNVINGSAVKNGMRRRVKRVFPNADDKKTKEDKKCL